MNKNVNPWVGSLLVLVGMFSLGIIYHTISTPKSVTQETRSTSLSFETNRETQASVITTENPIDSPLPTPSPTRYPAPTLLPPVAWDPLPQCVNQVWDSKQWNQYLTTNKVSPAVITSYLRQLQPMSTVVQSLDLNSLQTLLVIQDNDSNLDRIFERDVASLWLNVISTRLNRATELVLTTINAPKTVGDLLDQAEEKIVRKELSPALQVAMRNLLIGEGVSKAVCARILLSRSGKNIEQIIWTQDGLEMSDFWLRPASFHRAAYRLTPSPNYRTIAMESYGNETGGPIFLLDSISGELRNLIDELGTSIKAVDNQESLVFDQTYTWEVIGWHPDSEKLLIGVKDSGGVIWVNLKDATYRTIIPKGNNLSGSEEMMDLAADGNGFIYVNWGDDKETQEQVNYYDLSNNNVTTLFTFSKADGYLYYPRISPDGTYVAYLVESGDPTTRVNYSLRLFDRIQQSHTVLAEGDLSRTEPIWSPDGQNVAFAWKNSELHPGKLTFAEESDWRGNIWIATIPKGDLKEIVLNDIAARRPVWSSDSNTLLFSAQNGQIGSAPLDEPGVIHQMAQPVEWELFSSVFRVP